MRTVRFSSNCWQKILVIITDNFKIKIPWASFVNFSTKPLDCGWPGGSIHVFTTKTVQLFALEFASNMSILWVDSINRASSLLKIFCRTSWSIQLRVIYTSDQPERLSAIARRPHLFKNLAQYSACTGYLATYDNMQCSNFDGLSTSHCPHRCVGCRVDSILSPSQ